MSNGHTRHGSGRKQGIRGAVHGRRGAAVGVAALLAAALLAPAAGQADPAKPDRKPVEKPTTIAAANRQITQLDRLAEIASERYNTIRVRMGQATDRLQVLQDDVARQRHTVSSLRRELIGSAVSSYQAGGGLSTATSFLVSQHPGSFVDSLATNAVVENQQAGLLDALRQQQHQLGAQEQQARRALAAITADKRRLAAHKAEIAKRTKQVKAILASLKEKQRERLLALQRRQARAAQEAQAARAAQAAEAPQQPQQPANTYRTSRDTPRPPVGHAPASGRAKVAVETALAQLGDPYVYGAAGPDAFDCSGLTMYAWRAAGVSLPHSASLQARAGTPVSISALQPGDLVFYYSPISHVAMYIGNGQVVHAPHTGEVVSIAPLFSMPVAMAVHIG